jgi:hypothetical protein
MINPQSVLDVPMEENDAKSGTIREYLIKLLSTLWEEKEGFDGKRPFGNSSWDYDLIKALVKAGIIEGSFDEDGYLETCDDEKGDWLVAAAIISLGWVESPEPPAYA